MSCLFICLFIIRRCGSQEPYACAGIRRLLRLIAGYWAHVCPPRLYYPAAISSPNAHKQVSNKAFISGWLVRTLPVAPEQQQQQQQQAWLQHRRTDADWLRTAASPRRCHSKMSASWKIRPGRDNHGFDMSPPYLNIAGLITT